MTPVVRDLNISIQMPCFESFYGYMPKNLSTPLKANPAQFESHSFV